MHRFNIVDAITNDNAKKRPLCHSCLLQQLQQEGHDGPVMLTWAT